MKHYKTFMHLGVVVSVTKTNPEGSTISIPFDPANTDFQEYQRWLAEGNTPEPAETQE